MTLREFARQARELQPTGYVSVAAQANLYGNGRTDMEYRVWLSGTRECYYGKTPEEALAAARAAVSPQVPSAGEMDIGPEALA